jgi:hypothetical protein
MPVLRVATFCLEAFDGPDGRETLVGVHNGTNVEAVPVKIERQMVLHFECEAGRYQLEIRVVDPLGSTVETRTCTVEANDAGMQFGTRAAWEARYVGTYKLEVRLDGVFIDAVPFHVFPEAPRAVRQFLQ